MTELRMTFNCSYYHKCERNHLCKDLVPREELHDVHKTENGPNVFYFCPHLIMKAEVLSWPV